jgi:hypothetical protein
MNGAAKAQKKAVANRLAVPTLIPSLFNRSMDLFARFDILVHTMPPDTPTSPPSPRDRRDYYRITVTLPICLQPETATIEGELVTQPVNLSAGGIGLRTDTPFQPDSILSCTLLFPDQVVFKSFIEVLRVVPTAYPPNTYRLHARFIRMTTDNREQLVRYILQFQREHLTKHYSV